MSEKFKCIYPKNFTSEDKCNLWIQCGLAGEQEYELLFSLMEKYHPQTADDNILVFDELLRLTNRMTAAEYDNILENSAKKG